MILMNIYFILLIDGLIIFMTSISPLSFLKPFILPTISFIISILPLSFLKPFILPTTFLITSMSGLKYIVLDVV